MIYLCSLYSQDNWDSTFTTNGIILDVADIIHIQNTGREETDGHSRQHAYPRQDTRHGKITSHHAHYPEKDKHEKITQSPVTISTLPDRVFHGGHNRRTSGNKQSDTFPIQQIPKCLID